jgi:2-keto-3-deoxy-L-rhamnonate aldolase RhmA
MGAQIRSADHAREFVSWNKFAPAGTRGLNTGGRDADFTYKTAAQFIEDANRQHFVAVQIETLGALEDANDIAAIAGVDLLFVGPADLSLALGVAGQFHHQKLWDAIECVSQACRRNGIAWGAVVPDPEFAKRAIGLGCRMPTFGNDPTILRRGFETIRSTFGF